MPEAPAGELGEEPLDGVEPGTGGGREVEGPAGMARKPFADLGVLVSGIIVDDHVDDLPDRDVAFEGVEEADEPLMPVALHVSAEHLAGQDVQRGEERGRAVALAVMGHGRAAALLDRQARLCAVKRLDLGLLVETEDDGMGGRCDVEPNNGVKLPGEGGIVGELEAAPAVRRQTMRLPDPLHRRDSEAGGLRHRPRSPVGGLVWWRLQRHFDNLRSALVRDRRFAGRSGLVAEKAVEALRHISLLPPPDRGLRRAGRGHDRVRAGAVPAQQHDPGAPNMLLRRVAVCGDGLRTASVVVAERDGNSC